MSGERKHRSLKNLLRSGSPSLSNSHSSPSEQQTVGSHRFFLRKRNSKSSITSSSNSSINSNNDTTLLSIAPSESVRTYDSVHLLPLVSQQDEKKTKLKKKEKKEKRRGIRSSSSGHLLKRFFKALNPTGMVSNSATTPVPVLPLSKTSNLATKYDLGRLIGSGASGSVNLVNDKTNTKKIYAVKKFRAKLKGEAEHDYITKVKNEFLIGDHLLHQNLIHTIELIQDRTGAFDGPEFYIVMEYCPYDFFNVVMSGLMTKEEIYCFTKQIINGVYHLHQAGVAHRDLKLDNCVVDANGVLKLIDFGSAFQFKKHIDNTKPHSEQILLDDEHRLVLAKGIVGSDPYLSPEVFEGNLSGGYDARLADVWSIAIIFCCMLLKRFPWKVPRTADPSYRAFAGLNNLDEPVSDQEKVTNAMGDLNTRDAPPKYGPDRLLRLLPSRSRPLIRAMLQIDTSKRYFIEDVVNDPFFQSIEVCHYIEESEIPSATAIAEARSEPATQEANKESAAREEASAVQNVESSHESVDSPSQRNVDGSVLKSPLQESNKVVPANSDQSQSTAVSSSEKEAQVSEDAPSSSVKEWPQTTENLGVPADSVAVHTIGTFVKALNHVHHLVTERELEKLNAEREAAKRMQKNGMA